MATCTDDTVKYLKREQTTLLGSAEWTLLYEIGDTVPASGIYRCTGCGDEITSNKGDPFPTQNKHQHQNPATRILWQLIVKTQTKG